MDILLPLMKSARSGEIALLFLDASHFVMGCDFLGYIYGKFRRFIQTYSGRRRYNVLGALDFVTKKLVTVTNDSYITASEICDILKQVATAYKETPVYIVLDNARYQKCKIVAELADSLGIHLVYIPPYSPNLNLIERFWKHTKNKLRTKYYDDFNVFTSTIDSIINNASTADKHTIDRLISEKVQLFPTASRKITNHGKELFVSYEYDFPLVA
jgi:transposase